MKQFAILAALLLLVGAGCSFASETTVETNTAVEEEHTVMEDSTTTASEEASTDEPSEEESMATVELSGIFNIESGTSSYIAQKEFFSKPTQEITGTTSDVTGSFSVNAREQIFDLNASIQNTFSSGSGTRDSDVQALLAGPIRIMAEGNDIPPVLFDSGAASFETSLSLTIAGVTKQVPFAVSVSTEGNTVTAQGSATFAISSFGLTPPSLLNVYKVNDSITVQFDINAPQA